MAYAATLGPATQTKVLFSAVTIWKRADLGILTSVVRPHEHRCEIIDLDTASTDQVYILLTKYRRRRSAAMSGCAGFSAE